MKEHCLKIIRFIKSNISIEKICCFFIALITIFCIIAVGMVIQAELANESNRISEGFIIDKYYNAAYTSTQYYTVNGTSVPTKTYHPETYEFKIKGTKDGKSVEYTFDVTEREYNAYNIGDYYKK